MRYTISSISKKQDAAVVKTDAVLQKIASGDMNCIEQFFAAGVVARGIREDSMWALSKLMLEQDDFEIKDWTFSGSAKLYLEGYTSDVTKSWEARTPLEQANYRKLWSEVITQEKATGKSATDRRKAKKQAKKDAPLSYAKVLEAAKGLTAEEQLKLATYLAKQFSNVTLKVA